jgi:Arc/MetJ-type ribon-helix-helix transcriptional regulator
MKTATLPPVRVLPEFRAEIQSLLGEGETISEFLQTAVQDSVQRRRNQQEFVRRGLASLENAKLTDSYVDADAMLTKLERKLADARVSQSADHS